MKDQLKLELIQHMGSDQMIANAARVSTNTDTTNKPYEGLLGYLAGNGHLSPFEHNSITFRVEAPLFVRDQWVRHRTQSYNCLSLRYTNLDLDGPLQESFYIPDEFRPLENEGSKAHPKLLKKPDESLYESFMDSYFMTLSEARGAYNTIIAMGVAEEVARMVLPSCTMTKFYATANLRNWFAFVKERDSMDAQWEIRVLAREVSHILQDLFPVAWNALKEAM